MSAADNPTSPTPRTRLAPSPTGALHLGNARSFIINWALARRHGWRILLRIEDLDGPRLKPGADRQAIDLLHWLQIDWDEGPVYQSRDLAPYTAALAKLDNAGLTYPCTCTRSDIEQAASAPHGDEHELRYPGTCRPRSRVSGIGYRDSGQTGFPDTRDPNPDTRSCIRLIVPDEFIAFTDTLHGPQQINVQQQVGDFIVVTKAGLPAYQLAVVVDDARQGISEIVRGDDLIASTARQMLLYRYLDLQPLPRYTHLPLVLGSDGKRLAKRHGDTRLLTYRQRGVPPQRVIGLLAYWSGISSERQPMNAGEFAARFDLDKLPREPVTFTKEDDAWLLDV